jgi:hypothetical protein
MATTRTFQAMLNEFLPNDLLKEEIVKRDWVLQNVEKDDTWKGGSLIVPFKGIQASSVAFGSLTGSTDIAEDSYVRGEISTQPEVWGSMIFNHRDLMEHDKLSEQNFLKLLPDAVDDFVDYMKQCVSLNMLNGAAFAELTVDGAADGTFTTDRPERFTLKQKVYVDDDNSAVSAAGYVQSINMETGVISLDTTRAGGADLDISAYTVAQNAKVYFDGTQPGAANGFTALRLSLLSSANGGGTDLYGQTKTAYPYLQAINVSGSDVTAANILQKVFDAYVVVKNRGKGNPDRVIASYRNLGYILTILESTKGAYHIDQSSTKVTPYGWTEIVVQGVKGTLKVVGIQEMDDDVIFFLDMRALKIFSHGMFKKRVAPDGKEYFESRATTGYTYIVDMCFFGDLVLIRPSYCGVLHSIP